VEVDTKVILKKAYVEYNVMLTKNWKNMLETYRYSEEFAFGILEGRYDEESAETFEEEWMQKVGDARNMIEKKYGLHIEHDEKMIIISKCGLMFDGTEVENT
jgi:hypothetical protein